MEEAVGAQLPRVSLLQQTYAWFFRLVACCCLMFGLHYWIRLVGIYEGTLWRFDLMPVHWQVASVVLAVLFPFAASGLWMLATWGPVIWFVCAAGETAMHIGFPEMFGTRPGLIATHAGTLALFLAFRLALYIDARRRLDDR
jgi:hypothetical protein